MAPATKALLHRIDLFPSTRPLSLFTITQENGEKWAIFESNAGHVPHFTAASFYGEAQSDDTTEVPPAIRGRVWITGGTRDYLAYGVDYIRIRVRTRIPDDECWLFSIYADTDLYANPSPPHRIHLDLARKIKKDLKIARTVLASLDGRGGLGKDRVDVEYVGDDLESLEGYAAVYEGLRNAREIMDERCAAINFGLLHTQGDTKNWLTNVYGAYFRKWHLLSDMRGAYVDLQNIHPSSFPLLDYLSHGVTLAYPLEEKFCTQLTPAEVQEAETVKTGEELEFWLRRSSAIVPGKFTKEPMRKIYGLTLDERIGYPLPRAPKMDRFTELAKIGPAILGDLWPTPGLPIVSFSLSQVHDLTKDARLVLSPLTEARMMLWAVTFRTSVVQNVLEEALSRGWPFRIVYPNEHLNRLACSPPHSIPATWTQMTSTMMYADEDDFHPGVEWTKYIVYARRVTQRPHARAFLHHGNALWRLYLLHGGAGDASHASDLVGPSSSAIVHRSGCKEVLGHTGDDVSEVEKNILLGVFTCPNNRDVYSWFPPLDLLERYDLSQGHWSATEEHLFRDRFDSLQRGETKYRPLTCYQWEEELDGLPYHRLRRDSLVKPAPYALSAFLDDLREELRGSWNGQCVSVIERCINADRDSWWND